MNSKGYQCCFCGNSTDDNLVDSFVLVLMDGKDWLEEKNDFPTQQLWCHKRCLKELVYNNVLIVTDLED